MLNTYFKSDFASARTDLIVTADPLDALMPYSPYGVWDFGGSDASLNNLMGPGVLTPLSPTDITYQANSLTVKADIGKGIDIGIPDTSNFTLLLAIEITGGNLMVLAGNPSTSGKSEFLLLRDNKSITFITKNPSGGSSNTPISSSVGTTVGTYALVAVSFDKTFNRVLTNGKAGGVSFSNTHQFNGTYAKSGSNLALGNIGSNFGEGSHLDVRITSLTAYKKALTASELQIAVDAAIAREATRGITI